MTIQDNFSEIIAGVQDLVLAVSPDGKILYINEAVAQAASRPEKEIVGQGVCSILHGGKLPHTECPLEQLLLKKRPRVLETRLPGLHGDYLLTVSPSENQDGEVESILLFGREMSKDEIMRVENQHTARLASIGELASGVAHEINNPMNGIINFAQLLLDDCQDATQADLLERIVKEGERISSIVYKLLSFAREGDKEQNPLSMGFVLEECLALVQHQLKKDSIVVETEIAADLPPVSGNVQQLQQVVLNLISNSRYAINEKKDGQAGDKKIHITCTSDEVDGKKIVRTRIRDTGRGIPQGMLDRICDPFFTTKPAGQGTGLGLSISHGIIKDHCGTMRFDSVLREFTEVTVDLPVAGEKCLHSYDRSAAE